MMKKSEKTMKNDETERKKQLTMMKKREQMKTSEKTMNNDEKEKEKQ